MIQVSNVSREFKVASKEKGFRGAVKNVFAPVWEVKKAVDNISFSISDGEAVGFIGPNGAGKSTTVKMLSGILHPTIGDIDVNGFKPYRDRQKYVGSIGVVFGQRSQLWRELTINDTFDLLKHIYKIPEPEFSKNMEMFNDILELHTFDKQAVRQLSLGQRMRADIVAAFLHNPSVVFLDEPTIGLDVLAKERIRDFLTVVNKERGTTLLFTTHDLKDIETTCRRVMIIDGGQIIYDGSIEDIKRRYGKRRWLTVEFTDTINIASDLYMGVNITQDTENPAKWHFSFNTEYPAPELISTLCATHPVKDLTIQEPELEAIIREIYEGRV